MVRTEYQSGFGIKVGVIYSRSTRQRFGCLRIGQDEAQHSQRLAQSHFIRQDTPASAQGGDVVGGCLVEAAESLLFVVDPQSLCEGPPLGEFRELPPQALI